MHPLNSDRKRGMLRNSWARIRTFFNIWLWTYAASSM